jgi:type I restriction enzyme, S subunit
MPRYAVYKPSGVEWLGDVPASWKVRQLKYIAQQIVDKIREPLPDRLYIGLEHVTPWSGKLTVNADDGADTKAEGGCNLFKRGDVLFGKLRPYLAKGLEGKCDGQCSSEFIVLRPSQVSSRFLHHLMLSRSVVMTIDASTFGAKMPRAAPEFVMGLPMPVPPDEEQEIIASFLDRETAKIDALIEKKQRLIDLMEEKKRAVIAHAVIQGLNDTAPRSASGVAWFGDVPAHWELVPLRYLASEYCDGPFGSGLKTEHYVDHGVRVVRLQNIRAGAFDESDASFIDQSYFMNELRRHEVVPGDVLIAGLGDDRNVVGRACVAPQSIGAAMVKADCFRFRLNRDRAVPAFVAAQLTASSRQAAGLLSSGSTRSRIPLSVMAGRKVALPALPEQEKICAELELRAAPLKQAIETVRQAISLLEEHRTSLIAASVTGKIDLRGAMRSGPLEQSLEAAQ